MRVSIRVTPNTISEISAGTKARPKEDYPPAVATPFPPPFAEKKDRAHVSDHSSIRTDRPQIK